MLGVGTSSDNAKRVDNIMLALAGCGLGMFEVDMLEMSTFKVSALKVSGFLSQGISQWLGIGPRIKGAFRIAYSSSSGMYCLTW